MTTLVAVAADDYARIFEQERQVAYPDVDAFERGIGIAIDRARLERAARVLACPLKAHPPNWQHGRVLYALAHRYCQSVAGPVTIVDIGTAKGFSALCLLWAMRDAGTEGRVLSVDVLAPDGRVRRNTVAEIDGYKTLAETLDPWPESRAVEFRQMTGADAIAGCERVHICYLDGKHSYEAVSAEVALLATRQQAGHLVVWDDAHLDGVAKAIRQAERHYEIEYLAVLPHRRYAIGRRRG